MVCFPHLKTASIGSHIAYALEHLKTDNAAWDLRAKALLAVAYCTMARRAELVAIRVEDLSFNAQSGDGVALIRNTKAGREESRYLYRRRRCAAQGTHDGVRRSKAGLSFEDLKAMGK